MRPSSTFRVGDADGYEQVMGRWSQRLAEPFLDFAGMAPDEVVLDAGCGTGSLAQARLARGPIRCLMATDLEPLFVARAAQRLSDHRLAFHVSDVCALGLPDHIFDRVMALLVLHFVPDTPKALAELRRVAKPGALVAAAVWDARGGFVANRLFFDTAAALDPVNGEARRARNYTRPMTRPGELGHTWRAAGFEQVTETTLAIRMDFASFDDYWSPFTSRSGPGGDYVAALSEVDRARLRDAVYRAYTDGEPDGPRSYAALAWAVKGLTPTA